MYYTTVTPLLLQVLKELMRAPEFAEFRLVGGTSLSLQRGHRLSVDIDLFTDAPYGSVDFGAIDAFLRKKYTYVDTNEYNTVGMGRSYYVGSNKDEAIKLDLFYTDKFISEIVVADGIRLATVEEIIAMKIDVISRGGRKKDFWDIHELINSYSLRQMFAFHQQRYPYNHDSKLLLRNFTAFENAADDFEPVCLRNKY